MVLLPGRSGLAQINRQKSKQHFIFPRQSRSETQVLVVSKQRSGTGNKGQKPSGSSVDVLVTTDEVVGKTKIGRSATNDDKQCRS